MILEITTDKLYLQKELYFSRSLKKPNPANRCIGFILAVCYSNFITKKIHYIEDGLAF